MCMLNHGIRVLTLTHPTSLSTRRSNANATAACGKHSCLNRSGVFQNLVGLEIGLFIKTVKWGKLSKI